MRRKIKIFVLTILIPIFAVIVLFLYAVYFGFYANSDKAVSDYTGSANLEFLNSEIEAYNIAANIHGDPIFIDVDAAFEQAEGDYNDAFQFLYENFKDEYDLDPINKKNWEIYGILGWQIPTDNMDLHRQGSEISKFFDIYENSFKRWFLLPSELKWYLEVAY